MVFVYIVFAWLVSMIAWNIYKGKKEKDIYISKEAMRKYFNGRFR